MTDPLPEDLPRIKSRYANACLAMASVFLTLVFSVGADRIAGLLVRDLSANIGLIYPPGTVATYETLEFSFTVEINNLGFRGHDTSLEKSRALRCVILGDSFVYGWGVGIDDTWVKQVEQALQSEGYDIEILNLGVPGYNPALYALTAEELLPILKPDLVLVGLLQGDDLRQLEEAKMSEKPASQQPKTLFNSLLEKSYPNFIALSSQQREKQFGEMTTRSKNRWVFMNRVWKTQANAFIKTLDRRQRELFESWPSSVRNGFREGKLNPGLLRLSLVWGESNMDELDASSSLMQTRVALCSEQFERIKLLTDALDAKLALISIPSLQFTTSSVWSKLSGVDPAIEERMLSTLAQDEAAQRVSEQVGIPMLEVTHDFRSHDDTGSLFYPYDLHFTKAGHVVFADLLTPLLSEMLE